MNFSRHSGCGQRSLRCFSLEFMLALAEDDDSDDDDDDGGGDDASRPGDIARCGDVAMTAGVAADAADGGDSFFVRFGDGAAACGFGDSARVSSTAPPKRSLLATIGVGVALFESNMSLFFLDLEFCSEPDAESLRFADSDGERSRRTAMAAAAPPLPPLTGADDDDEPDVSSECFSSRSADCERLGGDFATCWSSACTTSS